MEISYPHTLPRQLGAKTFIVWFLLACAEEEGIVPVSRDWILDHMPDQTSPNTVTAALRWLCDPENQLAIRVTGGWRLASAVQLPLTLEIQKRAERPFEGSSSCSSSNRKELIFTREEEEQESEKRAERAFENEFYEANLIACDKANIREPKRTMIAQARHVTPKFIEAHVRQSMAEHRPLGTAIYRILHEWSYDPKYENEIKKFTWVCEKCNTYPCRCDDE